MGEGEAEGRAEEPARGRQAEEARGRSGGKSSSAFRTISEVSAELDVPQHVLRFWESKFTQLRPLKRGGGRRYYRPEDVALLRRIHELLYKEGYTIKGVQRVLRTPRKAESAEAQPEAGLPMEEPAKQPASAGTADDRHESLLREILRDLKELRALLD